MMLGLGGKVARPEVFGSTLPRDRTYASLAIVILATILAKKALSKPKT